MSDSEQNVEQSQQQQPDEIVLIDAKETLGYLTHKMVEFKRRLEALEQERVIEQQLRRAHESRIAALEHLIGGPVQ